MNKQLLSVLVIAGLTSLYVSISVCAESIQRDMRWEKSLTASNSYSNPFMDVTVGVRYDGPNGEAINSYGFWDGGNTFRIRNAFPSEGEWIFTTNCSDATDTGLHNQTGSITVTAYTGDNPFYQHGFLQVSADGRGLEHADGTPFFWMGETLWGATLWLSESGWQSAIDDLVAKHFTVLQTNIARNKGEHPVVQGLLPWDDANHCWNVTFMQKLDRELNYANDKGIYMFINALIDLNWDSGVSGSDLERLVKMIAIRYFAHHVSWSSSMDDPFSSQQNDIDNYIHNIMDRPLLTQHAGATDPYPPYGNKWTALQYYDEAYEDYVMSEPGGGWGWYFSTSEPSLAAFYTHEPHKPQVNGEALYEGINPDQGGITAEGASRLAWWTYLSGACGFTHGTVYWEALDADLPVWFTLPGRTYMKHAADFLKQVDEGRPLVPRHDFIMDQAPAGTGWKTLASNGNASRFVAHLPDGGTIQLNLSELTGEANVEWYNPLTGEYADGGNTMPGDNLSFTSPLGANPSVLYISDDEPTITSGKNAVRSTFTATANAGIYTISGKLIAGMNAGDGLSALHRRIIARSISKNAVYICVFKDKVGNKETGKILMK